MANPALIVRVAATIAELKANLAEGKSQIETTTAAMGKLAASFSGDKLIQAAQNVTAAVNQIGGASKLTEAEQARVNATLEKALEKYRVLGKEAPAGMQQLADDTRGADKASGGLHDTVKNLVLSYVALSSVRAIYDYAKQLINEASALKDLSQQTHISVEEIQVLAGGMSEFGVDADTLAKGLYKLSRGIAGGDESVARGLHLMGLSLKDVEGLNGKELFLKIEAGLATLQGGLRDDASAQLFGGKLGMAMAGASEGIGGAIEKWQRLNHVASTESVDALDQYGESIERTKKSLNSFATEVMGRSAQMFNVVTDAVEKGGGKWATFWALTKDVAAQLTLTGTGTENMTRLLDGLNQKTDAHTAATKGASAAGAEHVVVLTAQQQAVKFMAAIEADAAGALDAAQYKNLAHLKEIGQLNAANAAGIGVTAAQYAKYIAMVEQAAKTLELEKAATKLLQDVRDLAHLRQVEILRIQTTEQLKLAAVVNDAIVAELAAKGQLNAAHGLDVQGRQKVTSAAETLRLGLEALHKTAAAGIAQTNQEQVLTDAYTQSLYDEAVAQDKLNGIAANTPPVIDKASAAFAGATQAAGVYMNQLSMLVSDPSLTGFFGTDGVGATLYGGGKSGLTPEMAAAMAAGQFIQMAGVGTVHRAAGGRVEAGQPAIVGELRPELWIPDRGGTVVPGVGGGGATVVNVYITQPLGTPDALMRVIGPAVIESLRNSGTRFPVGT